DTYFHQYYGVDILKGEEWPHIISKRHFERVMGLIENRNPEAKIAFGGKGDASTLRIEPTCMTGVTLEDPVMNEEIFGPVLPVLTFKTLDEAFAIVRTFEKPLATYVFADDRSVQERVIRELPFGGATINDVVIHLANNHMGFGGVGNSGMGAYHGKVGFDCFTHYKSTLKKGTWLELPVRVPPFGDKIKLLRMLMK
ncbi:MAG: aldehyde dehydrogenase family protein, partial [Raoultibacter sp.]